MGSALRQPWRNWWQVLMTTVKVKSTYCDVAAEHLYDCPPISWLLQAACAETAAYDATSQKILVLVNCSSYITRSHMLLLPALRPQVLYQLPAIRTKASNVMHVASGVMWGDL